MEPQRQHGDNRTMWKAVSPSGDWCITQTEDDAYDMIGTEDDSEEFKVEQIVVTAEEWNEMAEFEGW